MAALLPLVASGCLYGFTGGGFPSHLRTVAILPFTNQTAEPMLTQEVFEAVRRAVEDRLGLRLAAEDQADAVVRGTVSGFLPDVPLSFETEGRNVQVTRRLVQITLSVEIYDQIEDRMLWQRAAIRVDGEYDPPNEQDGRRVALEKLETEIVDGAQSQW